MRSKRSRARIPVSVGIVAGSETHTKGIRVTELLVERNALSFWQRLNKTQGLFASDFEIRLSGSFDRQRTFSEQMVWMTSSGGVPSNSVMMENWLTSVKRLV